MFANDVYQQQDIDINSTEGRKALAKMITKLFELWGLSTSQQLNLLGLGPNSRSMLPRYRKGESPVSANRDVLERIGWLLSIHKSLRLLFPYDKEFQYAWVHRRNELLDNYKPIEIMIEKGFIGIATIARHLDFLRGQ